jgi:hypothetical protein
MSPGVPLVHISNGLVQQRFDVALAFALGHEAERTAWCLQCLDPVEAEQILGCSLGREY